MITNNWTGFHWVGLPLRIEQLGSLPGFMVRLLRELQFLCSHPTTDNVILKVVVPIGWVTDLTSTPELLPIAKEGRWSSASVIHDHLYATGRCLFKETSNGAWIEKAIDRRFADDVYLLAMKSLGVNAVRSRIRYLGVRTGGWIGWNKSRRVQHENQQEEVFLS